jgi:hypothetical protein
MAKKKLPPAIIRETPCVCDVCFKEGLCAEEEPCPPGWLFSQEADAEELTVCSEKCAGEFWSRFEP